MVWQFIFRNRGYFFSVRGTAIVDELNDASYIGQNNTNCETASIPKYIKITFQYNQGCLVEVDNLSRPSRRAWVTSPLLLNHHTQSNAGATAWQGIHFANQILSQSDLSIKLIVVEVEKGNGNRGQLEAEQHHSCLLAAPTLSAPVLTVNEVC